MRDLLQPQVQAIKNRKISKRKSLQLFREIGKGFSHTGRGRFRAEINLLLCGDRGPASPSGCSVGTAWPPGTSTQLGRVSMRARGRHLALYRVTLYHQSRKQAEEECMDTAMPKGHAITALDAEEASQAVTEAPGVEGWFLHTLNSRNHLNGLAEAHAKTGTVDISIVTTEMSTICPKWKEKLAEALRKFILSKSKTSSQDVGGQSDIAITKAIIVDKAWCALADVDCLMVIEKAACLLWGS
ncbi:hypothetical protein Celaphus_00018616, partial [Cervus elaphus hippelaphus]